MLGVSIEEIKFVSIFPICVYPIERGICVAIRFYGMVEISKIFGMNISLSLSQNVLTIFTEKNTLGIFSIPNGTDFR